MITDVFLDQKRVNVCEHMVKTAPSVDMEKCHQSGCETGRGEEWNEKIEWIFLKFNLREYYYME